MGLDTLGGGDDEDATTIWTHAVKQDIETYGRSFETVSEQEIAKGERVLSVLLRAEHEEGLSSF